MGRCERLNSETNYQNLQHPTVSFTCMACYLPSNPPSTIEQSSKTPSNRSISSRSRKFSFRNSLVSPGSLGESDRLRSQFPLLLPLLIRPPTEEEEDVDRANVKVSSSSAPIPESLHHPESSPSDCGVIVPSSEIDGRRLGPVISDRREACAWEVMSNCFLSAEFDVRRSVS